MSIYQSKYTGAEIDRAIDIFNGTIQYKLNGTWTMNNDIDLTPYKYKYWEGWFGCMYGEMQALGLYIDDSHPDTTGVSIWCTQPTYNEDLEWVIYTHWLYDPNYATPDSPEKWFSGYNDLTFDNAIVPEWLYRLVTQNGSGGEASIIGGGIGSSYTLNGTYVMNDDINLAYYYGNSCYVDYLNDSEPKHRIRVTENGILGFTPNDGGFEHYLYVVEDGGSYWEDSYNTLTFDNAEVPEWLYKLITENSVGEHTLHGTYIMNHPIDLTPYYNKTCFIDFLYGPDPCTRISVSDRDSIFAYDDEYGWFSIYNGGWEDGINTLTFDNAEVPEWLYELVTENGVEKPYTIGGVWSFDNPITVLANFNGLSQEIKYNWSGLSAEKMRVDGNILYAESSMAGTVSLTNAGGSWNGYSVVDFGEEQEVTTEFYHFVTQNATKQ